MRNPADAQRFAHVLESRPSIDTPTTTLFCVIFYCENAVTQRQAVRCLAPF